MKINKEAIAGEWIEHPEDDVSFHIRPFPFSKGVWSFNEETAFVNSLRAQYDYALLGWKGIMNEDETDFPCNEENRKFVFDFVGKYRSFIVEESTKMAHTLAGEMGN
jgi:hypothetical protein